MLRDYRELFNLTKSQAATRFSISSSYLTMLENHERYPSLVLAAKMSQFYGASIDCLFFQASTRTF